MNLMHNSDQMGCILAHIDVRFTNHDQPFIYVRKSTPVNNSYVSLNGQINVCNEVQIKSNQRDIADACRHKASVRTIINTSYPTLFKNTTFEYEYEYSWSECKNP